MAFLDVITCGFGAILLLIIIVKPAPVKTIEDTQHTDLLNQIAQLSIEVTGLRDFLATLTAKQPDQGDLAEANKTVQRQSSEIKQAGVKLQQIRSENEALQIAMESLKKANIRADSQPTERDAEVGGIPVDSEYVIFVIDNSGSMAEIWEQVSNTMNRILDIHPKVKGFQVMNDYGKYLVNSTRRKWLPDTIRQRSFVKKQLHNWNEYSTSSPVEGLQLALQTYANRYDKIAIYVLGDDFTGSSYDAVIDAVNRVNPRGASGEAKVRIHGIGFLSRAGGTPRYSTLMRAVTERNRGSFLALPAQ